MKCFYHPNKDAIGNCKNCGKGICRESATEIGAFLSCRNKECEDKLKMLDRISDKLKQSSEAPGYIVKGGNAYLPIKCKVTRRIMNFLSILVIVAIIIFFSYYLG